MEFHYLFMAFPLKSLGAISAKSIGQNSHKPQPDSREGDRNSISGRGVACEMGILLGSVLESTQSATLLFVLKGGCLYFIHSYFRSVGRREHRLNSAVQIVLFNLKSHI